MKKPIKCMIAAAIISIGTAAAQPLIVAHRGHWTAEGSAQNSLASLRMAATEGFWGCEFDVQVTEDGIPIVYHDDDIEGKSIEAHDYLEFRFHELPNGETVPTLRDYLLEAARYPDINLVLEIKEATTADREKEWVVAVLDIVRDSGVADRTEYISFSYVIVKEILRLQPRATVSYLNGDLSPVELSNDGNIGMDYELDVLLENPEWIGMARELGLPTNCWTVNSRSDMMWLIGQGIDMITTDEPLLLRTILSE